MTIKKAGADEAQVAVNLENNDKWKHRLRAQRALEPHRGGGEEVNGRQPCAEQFERERGQTRRGQQTAQFHPTAEHQGARAETKETLHQRDPPEAATDTQQGVEKPRVEEALPEPFSERLTQQRIQAGTQVRPTRPGPHRASAATGSVPKRPSRIPRRVSAPGEHAASGRVSVSALKLFHTYRRLRDKADSPRELLLKVACPWTRDI